MYRLVMMYSRSV